jgi:hypothetical protein
MSRNRSFKSFAIVLVLAAVGAAQDVASFEKRTTVKKLDNGLTVVICERPEAPVFSFFTHVDAGSVQDPLGQTGLAHMFEHMAFKGTDKIGTKDYAAEKVALEKVEHRSARQARRAGREETEGPGKGLERCRRRSRQIREAQRISPDRGDQRR